MSLYEKVGRENTDGYARTVYRAKAEFQCVLRFDGCPIVIRVGELFTLSGYPGGGMRRRPACRGCEPFEFEVGKVPA